MSLILPQLKKLGKLKGAISKIRFSPTLKIYIGRDRNFIQSKHSIIKRLPQDVNISPEPVQAQVTEALQNFLQISRSPRNRVTIKPGEPVYSKQFSDNNNASKNEPDNDKQNIDVKDNEEVEAEIMSLNGSLDGDLPCFNRNKNILSVLQRTKFL